MNKDEALKEVETLRVDTVKALEKAYNDYDAKYEAWEKEKKQLVKEKSFFEAQLDSLSAERQRMKTFAEVDSGFRKLFEPIFKELIREELRKSGGGGYVPPAGTEAEQQLILENVSTKIKVEKAPPRTLPKVSDDTPEGEIVELIRQGKLDVPKREREIKEMMADGADGPTIIGPLQKLTKDRVLLRIQKDKTHVAYKKHPKVTVEEA